MSKNSNPEEIVPTATLDKCKAWVSSWWPPLGAPESVDGVLDRAKAATGMAACFLGAYWVLAYPFL